MSLFIRFKKDYFNYLISIILPAFIAGISVPVFKHLLGAQGYGHFSIYLNAVLIVTAASTGWITQSIYRFYPVVIDKALFAKLSRSMAIFTFFICCLPFLWIVQYREHDLFLSILVCLALFVTSMQFYYIAIAQASFLSKKTIYSETIRAVTYIVVAVGLLLLAPTTYLYALFTAVILAFTLSVLYLKNKTANFLLNTSAPGEARLTHNILARQFFRYGAPLSLWIVFANLLSYVDKLLILKYLGPEAQGNYQAIFDLLSRGITVLISPVIISLFPLLSQAYGKGESIEIRQLVKRILQFEAAGFLLVAILYWAFGVDILFMILKIPNTGTYRLMGFLVIAGTFLWQMAMVVHERYVLRLKSLFLLGMIVLAFCLQLVFYWIFRKSGNPIIYPLGYLFSAVMYLFFVSFSYLPVMASSVWTVVKTTAGKKR